MRIVEVKASSNYRVLIGKNLLQNAGNYAAEAVKPCRAAIVTDDTVNGLYAETAERSLLDAGFSVCKFVFPHGEESKSAGTYLSILEFLAKERLTRSDLLVALGGGVTGDLAGFAAATYLRGIRFIQIPTTLLAAVDSSVGGKTGIDLKAGKNLAGAFWQPSLVLCDYETLGTLPPETFADGVAESIKYGILTSPSLFARFEAGDVHKELEEIIEECISIKRDVVMKDEFDNGRRQFLNLGHTFGHAVEKKSGFKLTHGHAVAVGTVIAAEIAADLGLCQEADADRIRRTLRLQGLPISTEYTADELLPLVLSDKKRRGDSITLILPEAIGKCRLYPVSVQELPKLLEAGLKRMRKACERQDSGR